MTKFATNKVQMTEQKGLTHTTWPVPLALQQPACRDDATLSLNYPHEDSPAFSSLAKKVRRVPVPVADSQTIYPGNGADADEARKGTSENFATSSNTHTMLDARVRQRGDNYRADRVEGSDAAEPQFLDALNIEALIASYRSMIHPSVRERLLERQASIISRVGKQRQNSDRPASVASSSRQRRVKTSTNATVIAGEILHDHTGHREAAISDYFAQPPAQSQPRSTVSPQHELSRSSSMTSSKRTPNDRQPAVMHSRTTSRASTDISDDFRWSVDSKATHRTASTSYTGTAVSDSVNIKSGRHPVPAEVPPSQRRSKGHAQQSSIDSMASFAMSEAYNDTSLDEFPEPPSMSMSRRPSQMDLEIPTSISRSNSLRDDRSSMQQATLPVRCLSADVQTARPESRRSTRSTAHLGLTVHTSAPVRRVTTSLS